MTHEEIVHLKQKFAAYEEARDYLRRFKNSLCIGNVIIKGVSYPIWRTHEMWDDWDDSILIYKESERQGIWKGMERVSIADIDEVIPYPKVIGENHWRKS